MVSVGVAVVAIIAVAATVLLAQSDTGTSATPISQVGTRDYHALAMAPGNPDLIFFGHHDGILTSSDGGRTWRAVPGLNQDAMNLAIAHQRPHVMYLAGHDVFMKSEDAGQTWRHVQNNLPGLDLHWFAMDPDNPSKLYANAVGFGLHRSVDGGATWTPWALQIPDVASISALAVMGGDPASVLAGGKDGKLFVSADSGATWKQVGIVDSMPMAFALNPDAGTIYVGSMNAVYRSEDKGLTWARLSLNTTVVTLATGGSDPERVIVVNNKGEVFRSNDGGQTW